MAQILRIPLKAFENGSFTEGHLAAAIPSPNPAALETIRVIRMNRARSECETEKQKNVPTYEQFIINH